MESDEDQEAFEVKRLARYVAKVVAQTGRTPDDSAVLAIADLWMERDHCSSQAARGQLTKELTRQLLAHLRPKASTATPTPDEWVATIKETPDLLLRAMLESPDLLQDPRIRKAVLQDKR